MYVSITRFKVNDAGLDNERIDEVVNVTRRHPGWLGAYVFRDPDDASQMVRFTYWESLEARDSLYESQAARAIGLTEPPTGREVLELVRADRPIDPSGEPPVPDGP
jgi:heme-degrading monooxygenase HmoA